MLHVNLNILSAFLRQDMFLGKEGPFESVHEAYEGAILVPIAVP